MFGRRLGLERFWLVAFLVVLPVGSSFADKAEESRKVLLEALAEPKNMQTFKYPDFGPEKLTTLSLEPSAFFGKKPEDVKVLVFAGGSLEAQYLTLLDEGKLVKEGDYRVLWYPDAVNLLDEVLKSGTISPTERARVEGTRAKLLKEMGPHEEVMARHRKLREVMSKVSMKLGRERRDGFRLRFSRGGR